MALLGRIKAWAKEQAKMDVPARTEELYQRAVKAIGPALPQPALAKALCEQVSFLCL